MKTSGHFVGLFVGSVLMSGCAIGGDPRDPLEPMNRAVYTFNEVIDEVALRPVAKGYRALMPKPAQTGISNFFSNLDDVTVFSSNLLQFKIEQATSDFLRVAFNSTFGLFGLLDVATEMGLKKHNEDFGQTLGRWGVSDGPYLVLPIFGPSSFRDTVGLVADSYYTDPVYRIESMPDRNGVSVLRGVNRRADLLEAKQAIEEAALDGYEFNRDFYLDRRAALVYDGRPPQAE